MATKRNSQIKQKPPKAKEQELTTIKNGKTEVTYVTNNVDIFQPNMAMVGTENGANGPTGTLFIQFDYVISNKKTSDGRTLMTAKALARVHINAEIARSVAQMLLERVGTGDAVKVKK